MSRKITLQHASQSEPVSVSIEKVAEGSPNDFHVVLGDRRIDAEIELFGSGAGWIRLGGKVVRFYGHRQGDDIQVWYGGKVYDFKTVDAEGPKGAVRGAVLLPELTAPMPGTILRILVADGDELSAHQPLIIMESMKMEMTISAPAVGCVKEITCSEGDLVEMGALLIRLEDSGGGAGDE